MLVSALAPLVTAGLAAAFVLPDSLRANNIDIDSFYPESFKDFASAVKNAEHVIDALIHPDHPATEDKTFYELIAANPKFTKLTKVVNFAGEPIVNLLNSTDVNFTFFAVPDSGLRRPGHHGDDLTQGIMSGDSEYDLADIYDAVEGFEAQDDGDNDGDDDEKKELFRKIAQAILLYHVVPEDSFTSDQLSINTTFATNLTLPDDSLKGQPLRLRVSPTLHRSSSLVVNFYAKIIKSNVHAKNGIAHVINHPLLPPPSIFQELFQLPHLFSIATSTLQRTNLYPFVEYRYVPSEDKDGEGSIEGNPAVTHFAPTNGAFNRLPKRLQLFLFSPFGEKALKKILAYHIVPNYVLHTDYAYNVTTGKEVIVQPPSDTSSSSWIQALYPASSPHVPVPLPPTYYSFTLTPGTLLGQSHPLHISVTKRELKSPLPGHAKSYITSFEVNGERVAVPDGPARNGAVHAIGKLLDPRGKKEGDVRRHGCHGEEGVVDVQEGAMWDWEDWEEWLPQWAEEELEF